MMPRLAGWWDSDLAYSFRRSPVAVVSTVVLAICLGAALFAPWVAPHNPFNLATLNLLDALSPPRGMAGSRPEYLLGTDDRAATCCRRSCSGRGYRCSSALHRSPSRWS
jgi:peptide/nickel transport system permease protein